MSALTIVSEPGNEPLTTAEAKSHMRVDIADDDTLIDTYVTAARQWVEQFTRRALITQTWDYFLDAWPAAGDDDGGDRIILPMPLLQSATSVKYTDTAGTVTTLSSGLYQVDTDSVPGRILLNDGESWPSETLRTGNGVEGRFVAGYGDASTAIPTPIIQAMRLLVADMYEHREETIVSNAQNSVNRLGWGMTALLWPYRVVRWP